MIKVVKNNIISYNDFPNDMCFILYVTKCNFKCHYCFNMKTIYNSEIDNVKNILDLILSYQQQHKLPKNITITGGEISLEDINEFKSLLYNLNMEGFRIKIDTNLSNLYFILSIIHMIDYLAVDIKSPPLYNTLNHPKYSIENKIFNKYITNKLSLIEYYRNIKNLLSYHYFNKTKITDYRIATLIFRTTLSKVLFPDINYVFSMIYTIESFIDNISKTIKISIDEGDNLYPKIDWHLNLAQYIENLNLIDNPKEIIINNYNIIDILNHELTKNIKYFNLINRNNIE